MEYRRHKDFLVSEIGIGCYSVSGVYGTKNIDEFKKTINRAYELGVNFFDTAESYGNAEEILGEVVKPYRKDIYIATKVGIKKGVVPILSEEYIRTSCEESLVNLKSDYIDLYQVHFDDPNTPIDETVNALEKLKKGGKIRHYGIGHLPVERVKSYFKIGDPFSLLMELSAVSRHSKETLLPLCKEYNIGIIAFSTTGRGILTGRFQKGKKFEPQDIRNIDPLFQYERFESALRITERFIELGKKYGKTSTQVAINWVLAQPNVICALVGPSTIPHLEEDVKGSGWRLDKEDLETLEIFFKQEDEWLKTQQLQTLNRVLFTTSSEEPFKSFVDLVYAVETAILLNMVEEKDILPVFQKLYGMYKNLGEISNREFENIREEIRKVVNF